MNRTGKSDKDQFMKNVDKYAKEYRVLERFFKDRKDIIKDVAQKAVDLEQDPDTDLGDKEILPKVIKVFCIGE